MRGGIIGIAAACAVAAAAAEPLDLQAAWQQLKQGSPKLAAAQAAADVQTARRQGIDRLGGPQVSLSGAAAQYHAALTIDLEAVNGQLAGVVQQLPVPLQNLPIALPSLPPSYTYSRSGSLTTASVSAVMPVYLGGANDAARGLVDAQADEARADERKTEHELATLLAQRYFGAQLARRAAALRDAALATVTRHDQAAEEMLKTGVLSRVERLQARAALEDARRNADKARSDAALADRALAVLLKADTPVEPATPLFVDTVALPPLSTFVDAALGAHPGLAKVAAKQAQAERSHEASTALRKPQVFLFGQRDLKTGEQANWVAGIGARWTLFDSLDRRALDDSSHAQVRQAQLTAEQARSDIALLVERHWRAAELARGQVLASQAQLDLADELVRLRAAGLREGTSTPLERMEADLNLAKVQTERAQAAYDYVMALANLLEASGQPEALAGYAARASLKIPPR